MEGEREEEATRLASKDGVSSSFSCLGSNS